MKLVGYVRVSTKGQADDGYGLDVQRQQLELWCEREGHDLSEIVADRGVSGSKPAFERPALTSALAQVQLRHVDGIVVPRLDRLARELTIQEAILLVVWQAKGTVFCVDGGEVLQDDPDDPMRTALRQMQGVFAELERRLIMKRMREGLRLRAQSGKHPRGRYAYGYRREGKGKDSDATPFAREQDVIKRICAMRELGSGYKRIANLLNELQIPPPGARYGQGTQWTHIAVRRIYERETSGRKIRRQRKVS